MLPIFRMCILIAALIATGSGADATPGDSPCRPNIIFILADDLGYGDLGCYGQQVIRTPRIDRMAREGLRFTQMYAGSTVCAPSRSVLMTGQHLGHTWVRGNGAGAAQALRAEDITVAECLQHAGYATALVGKWGLGDEGEAAWTGRPTNQGFDHFFGYLNQHHAHNYYPAFLWKGESRLPLANTVPGDGPFGRGWAEHRVDYSHDLFINDALDWVRGQDERPFFLFLALTIPHANNEAGRGLGNGAEVPDFGPYADRDWPDPDKGQAAMISRMDRDVGRLLDLLDERGIAERTVVFFSSDNGPHNEARHDLSRFAPAGPLRGIKRSLYEGGIRVPFIVRWPGTVAPGESDHLGYFGDFLATACDLASAPLPEPNDSISLVPTLRGRAGEQRQHEALYWEFYEQGSRQAVRAGRWKAIRQPMVHGRVELYDLEHDLSERHDLATRHPDITARLEAMMTAAHRPHPLWRVPPAKTDR
jgi:arylsulfatase A-like enzyme